MLASLILSFQQADADFAKVWDKSESAIRGRYYAAKARKVDLDRIMAKYAPIAKASKSQGDFDKAMDSLIADFGDSHFDFLTNNEQGFYAMDSFGSSQPAPMPNIGAWFAPTADGYTVQMVLEGKPAEKAGLRKGDVILSIDGIPFSPIASLRDRVDKQASITYRRGRQTQEAKVDVISQPAMEMFLTATKDSARIIESGGKKYGYVHLWTMASDAFRAALSSLVYGMFAKTDGIILDIRDGFGGRPEGYGDPFFRPNVNIEWKTGGGSNFQMFGYDKPLVVLINGGSRSAKEVFSAVMKKTHRATLIGSTTKGAVLGTSPMKVADWAYIEIPMVDVIVDGVRLEGKGIAPDIAVAKEFDDSGEDLYIKEAVKYLSAKRS